MSPAPLAQRKCQPCEGGTPPLPASAAQTLLADVKGWELIEGKAQLVPSTERSQ